MKKNENKKKYSTSLHSFSKKEIEDSLNAFMNKTLGEIDEKAGTKVFERTLGNPKITGIAGDVIERAIFKYPANSMRNPDLLVDSLPVELKTTGLRIRRIGEREVYEAKEPASITSVSPETITTETFHNSAF